MHVTGPLGPEEIATMAPNSKPIDHAAKANRELDALLELVRPTATDSERARIRRTLESILVERSDREDRVAA